MPRIRVRLSLSGVEEALTKLEAYQQKVEKLGENVTKTLAEKGAQQAKELAMYMNAYDSGDLVNGIVAEYRENKGYVHSTAPHTAYVEMGTGIVGQTNPNPNGTYPGWEYDVNEHGEAGWFYIGSDGKRHWTKGMPSRPFMYDTAQMMKAAIPDIVREELESD